MEAGKPLDLITLSEYLEQREQLEDVGGFAYLADLAKNTPSAANINAYAEIVAERALVRNLIGVANEIADAGYDPQGAALKICWIWRKVKFLRLPKHVPVKTKARKTWIAF